MEKKEPKWQKKNIIQAEHWRNCTREDLDMPVKEKPQERNWISGNRSSNNAMRTNYNKTNIDMKLNNDYILSGDSDKTVQLIKWI